MAVASSASADVARYQTQSMTITAVQPEGAVGQWTNVWTHTYNVDAEPVRRLVLGRRLDQRHASTASSTATRRSRATSTANARQLHGDRAPDGVVYSLSNAPLDNSTVTLATSTPVVPWALEFKVSTTKTASSNYKNHGDYVSSQGGGSDAAHSCIGMPIH